MPQISGNAESAFEFVYLSDISCKESDQFVVDINVAKNGFSSSEAKLRVKILILEAK